MIFFSFSLLYLLSKMLNQNHNNVYLPCVKLELTKWWITEVYWIAAGISSPASAGLPLGGWLEGDTVDQVKQWRSYLRRGDLGGLGDPDGQVDQKARVCPGGLSRHYLLSAPDGEKGRACYKSRTLQTFFPSQLSIGKQLVLWSKCWRRNALPEVTKLIKSSGQATFETVLDASL